MKTLSQITLTDHQRNRLENLRMQRIQIDESIKVLMIDIIDSKNLTLKKDGDISYDNGVFSAEVIPHSAVVKEKLKGNRKR